ncbi:MAG TPA: TonB family protein [Thermoanaerobaculia bacterium]|nr:TonB family protein [Thermoanaerobaculia bacterium]
MEHPTRFGRYLVKGVIGKGAMGVIYLAEDPVIGRQVAIKVIQLQPGLSEKEIENLKTRFEREFRSAGTLSHPNIVTVHDVGSEGNAPFIAMEYVEGKTLEHLLNEQRPLSFEEISELVSQICDALDFAHGSGVVHRDIKPANILLDRSQRPKITDFGVAKLADTGMTHTGAMVGTPWYMSPEQVVGESITGAADQFAVAVMTYQILTRERPFSGERSSTVLYKIVHEEPTRPHLLNPRLTDLIDQVLMQAFQKNPDERYPSCAAFADDLSAALGVAAWRGPGKSQPGAPLPATEWPTEALKLDPQVMQQLQSTARSGAASGAGSGAGSRARSKAGSSAGSGAGSRAGSVARSAAASAASAAVDAVADPDATAYAAPPAGTTAPIARAPARAGLGARRSLLIAAGAIVVLGAGLGLWMRGGGAATTDSTGAAEVEAVALDANGQPLDGAPGIGGELEASADAASSDAAEGALPGPSGEGVAADTQTYRIVTRPAGATVLLDGTKLDQVTPAEVMLRGDARHSVRLELEGHAPVGWTFSADRLTAEQARNRTLFFPLAAVGSQEAAAAAPAADEPASEEPATAAVASAGPTSPPGRIDRSAPTVRPGRDVPPPKRIQDAAPVYARESVPTDREAFVILELTLDPRGEVAEAKVLRSLNPELDQAALRAVYQWRYEPSVFKGKPANVVVATTVRFETP